MKYDRQLVPRAKELRVNMTQEENILWYRFLCMIKPRFQRQKVIDHFIADFYCHQARLIIEIDGSQHITLDGMAYDEERTRILQTYNLSVIRFSNKEINEHFDAVCSKIKDMIEHTINQVSSKKTHLQIILSKPPSKRGDAKGRGEFLPDERQYLSD